MQTIALYGGTFDPIHNGHISTALSIQSAFNFNQFYFIPCKIPVLKPPSSANAHQRVQMLQIALNPYPAFHVDCREITQEGPSYMSETLQNIRNENQEASITLILGIDAFSTLPQWYQWEKIINLSNILIMERPFLDNKIIPIALQDLLKTHQIDDNMPLLQAKYGKILFFNAGHFDIASRDIRQNLQQGISIESYLPSEVFRYIKKEGLYITRMQPNPGFDVDNNSH